MKRNLIFVLLILSSLCAVEKPLMFSQPSMQSDNIVTAPSIEDPTPHIQQKTPKTNNVSSVIISDKKVKENVVKAKENYAERTNKTTYIKNNNVIRLTVTGLGVAPSNITSKAQSFALAKRAAITDAYRLLAEKIKGVNVVGEDTVKNAIVTKTTVRTEVDALISKATIIDTRYKKGLCEVDLELLINVKEWSKKAAQLN